MSFKYYLLLGLLGWSSNNLHEDQILSTIPPSAICANEEGKCSFLKTLYFHVSEIWHNIMILLEQGTLLPSAEKLS